ncbi:MAG: hypothetical protein AB7V39_00510 [Nitrospiraceae bacterium]
MAWPTTISTNDELYVVANLKNSTLSGGITDSQTTILLTSAAGFPTTTGVVLIVTPGADPISGELVQYTGVSGNNLTGCTRGFGGTTATSHAGADDVFCVVAAEHHNALRTALQATQQTIIDRLGPGSSAEIRNRQLTVVFDGLGSVVSTGPKQVYLRVPYNMTITGWELVADQTGSIVVDIWKDTYANFPPTVADTITGSEKPTLVGQLKNQDLSLTSFSTNLTAGDYLEFNVDSASTVTKVILTLFGTVN